MQPVDFLPAASFLQKQAEWWPHDGGALGRESAANAANDVRTLPFSPCAGAIATCAIGLHNRCTK
jgi:hypothetical protein